MHHRSVCTLIGKHIPTCTSQWRKNKNDSNIPAQSQPCDVSQNICGPKEDSHFDTVTVKQSLACAAPPAAPFYVSEDKPASKIASIRFSPAWIGELHPAPTRQFLALMSGAVEMETTDGTVRRFRPGDLVLLEDTSGKGYLTTNIADGVSTFLVVPVPVA